VAIEQKVAGGPQRLLPETRGVFDDQLCCRARPPGIAVGIERITRIGPKADGAFRRRADEARRHGPAPCKACAGSRMVGAAGAWRPANCAMRSNTALRGPKAIDRPS